ncbi:MAG: hypothetical protein M3O97_01480, partial [Thermoproteota archaeon]|nr:hypothetical protein [Thermoproteota archaeon]
GLAIPFMDNTKHNIIKMKHIINTATERGCKRDATTNQIVTRRGVDTERIRDFDDRVVEKLVIIGLQLSK